MLDDRIKTESLPLNKVFYGAHLLHIHYPTVKFSCLLHILVYSLQLICQYCVYSSYQCLIFNSGFLTIYGSFRIFCQQSRDSCLRIFIFHHTHQLGYYRLTGRTNSNFELSLPLAAVVNIWHLSCFKVRPNADNMMINYRILY